jgi:hypothetical protein
LQEQLKNLQIGWFCFRIVFQEVIKGSLTVNVSGIAIKLIGRILLEHVFKDFKRRGHHEEVEDAKPCELRFIESVFVSEAIPFTLFLFEYQHELFFMGNYFRAHATLNFHSLGNRLI